MHKIYFASNWGQSSEQIANFYKRQSPNGTGRWGNVISVNTMQEADFVIVLDDTTEHIPTDKRVIFLGREPDYVRPRIKSNKWKSSYNFLHHEFNNCWLAQTWWVDMNYETLNDLPPIKTKKLSVIDSGKVSVPGHRDRIETINKMIIEYPHDIDVYGKITINQPHHPSIQTVLPHKDKRLGLLDYRYSLVIENGSTDYYFSEKISDSLMCWTMPIYYGCKQIHKFLPEGSYINIDINSTNVTKTIKDIIDSNYAEKNIENLKKARTLIMNKYNIWPTIEKAINKETFIL